MLLRKKQLSPDDLLLVVEAGNTTTSLAVFQGDNLLEVFNASSKELSGDHAFSEILQQILIKHPSLCHAAICSVVPLLEHRFREFLGRHLRGEVLTVTASLNLPFILHYGSPESFGADRLALCAMSQYLYPEQAVIAIDIGTAITVDVLGSSQQYLGGLIMPGLDLMAKSLHEHTARLPLVALDRPETLLGFSTADGIRNGIIYSCAAGMEGLIAKITRWLHETHDESDIRVLLTGGNASFIAEMLDCALVVEQLAVVKGTHYLFCLNADLSD